MTYAQAVAYFKNVNLMIAACDPPVTHQSASQWKTSGQIPYRRQKHFEQISKGVLKADPPEAFKKNSKLVPRV